MANILVSYPIWAVNVEVFHELKKLFMKESHDLVGIGIDPITYDRLPGTDKSGSTLVQFPEIGYWSSIKRYFKDSNGVVIPLDKPKKDQIEIEAAKTLEHFSDYSTVKKHLESLLVGISQSPDTIMTHHLTKVWNKALEMADGYLENKVGFMEKTIELYKPDMVIVHSREAELLEKRLTEYKMIVL